MTRLRSHTPLLVFALGVAGVYGAAFVIVSRLGHLDDAALVAGALTLDLTLLVPVLYYLLLVRWRGWPAITVVPVFLGSVAIAHVVIPESQHHVLDAMFVVTGIAEIVLVGFFVHRVLLVRRLYREHAAAGLDVYTALREAARPMLGPIAGTVLAYEVTVFHYALFGWRRSRDGHRRSFTYHRDSGYAALAAGLMIAVCVETVAVHLLVRIWSPVTAWILTGLSAYAFVWLIGDTHAVRLRPIVVSDTMLHVRVGLRWTIDVPVDAIVSVSVPDDGALPRRTPGYLNTVLLGAPNRRLRLSTEVVALGPYGLPRRVSVIDLRLDEPCRFDDLLDRTREA